MKHDLYPIIIENLKNIYGLKDETEGYLYKYLYIRASINYNKKKISETELFNFIIEELNLTVFDERKDLTSNYLMYKEEKHYIFNTGLEFYDNFLFRAELEDSIDLKEEQEKVFGKGYQKAYKYRKLVDYRTHQKYCRLLVLNDMFGANPIHSEGIEGFEVNDSHNPMKRSLEEQLEVAMNVSKHGNSNTTSYITEEELEDYLVENLDLIEKGLMLVKRQFSISGGFIDILAKDSKGNMCIIEIKISEDKNIVWQSLHYPNEIKKEYNSNVRMITVAPEYSTPIYNALKSIGNVEMFSYTIGVSNSEISKLTLMKTRMPKEKRSL